MSSRSSSPAQKRQRTMLLAVVLVIVLIASSVGAFVLLDQGKTVKTGDLVRVDYIGKLPDGRVFDTSMHSVAVDNDTYPKSLFFTYRGSEAKYSTLNFTVGAGAMIDGFETGVQGMKVGETKTIVIPPEDGYGDEDPTKLVTLNLTETIPFQQTLTVDAFRSVYGTNPVRFNTYTNPTYGWDVYVTFLDSSNVILQNKIPAEGATYRAYASSSDASYGWQIAAEYDQNMTNIIVHHQLDASSAMTVKGYQGNARLYVQSVDEAAGTAVLNKNLEVVGKDLTFIITVVSIG
ncbi:MAG: FKBP-type peptidyl-prolyl cis-trans isomerase [Methanomassiliicoccus sp.]|nr:FKBP-type peptidyl-prolyl cis-trans isomerase [Methanomassiliicoccus sp.]